MKATFDIDDDGMIAGTGQPSVELTGKGGVKGVGKRDAHGCLLLDDKVDSWMVNYNGEGEEDVLFEYPQEWRLS